MNKTLKLEAQTALKLYPTASTEFKTMLEETFGKEFFNQKITDKVYNIDTLCEYLEIDESDLFIYKKNTKDKHERYINVCNILPKIAQVYNEGIILDWKNINIYKYLPYLYFSGGSGVVVPGLGWGSYLLAPAGLYFKTNNLSETAYKNFKSYYEDFWGLKVD